MTPNLHRGPKAKGRSFRPAAPDKPCHTIPHGPRLAFGAGAGPWLLWRWRATPARSGRVSTSVARQVKAVPASAVKNLGAGSPLQQLPFSFVRPNCEPVCSTRSRHP
jgi:hypothetical protein